jgi:UDP-glucose 4-epimerase
MHAHVPERAKSLPAASQRPNLRCFEYTTVTVEKNLPSGAYNIGTGVETSVNRLYELLEEVSGRDLAPRHGPAKAGEQLRSCVDPSRAGRVLGWHPETSLATDLIETLRFFGALPGMEV